MKRIVHITIMHPSSDTRIFRNECISMVKAGYEVILCAPHTKNEIVDGVRIVPVFKPRTFLERIFTAPKRAVEIASKMDADIYHFHDPELLFAMAALAKKPGINVVWDAHENYADTIYSFNSLKIRIVSFIGAYFFGRFELYFAKKRFKGVVTVTDIMAKKYRDKGILTATAGNFSDISNIPGAAADRPKSPLVFISSGMQFKERSVVEIAQAFNLLQNETPAILRYAGKFKTEELKQEIIGQVRTEMQDKLELSGPYTWEELVQEHIPKAHIGFVLFDTSDPNNCNGLPNRFFECWSNGLPVITTAGTQVARIVAEEKGGIVIPNNAPHSIAEAMNKFLDDPALAKTMGRNARKAVEEKYSWGVAFQNINQLYTTVLKR
jgi:glycosyltransferase involved in cell wall biosynthesis